jgi:hypothetical protein
VDAGSAVVAGAVDVGMAPGVPVGVLLAAPPVPWLGGLVEPGVFELPPVPVTTVCPPWLPPSLEQPVARNAAGSTAKVATSAACDNTLIAFLGLIIGGPLREKNEGLVLLPRLRPAKLNPKR